MSWMERYDLGALLEEGGGLAKIPNFLPTFVADGLLAMCQAISDEEWTMTAASRDHSTNNISHKFWSTKSAAGLAEATRAFSCLMPGKLNTAFSAAKYCQTHHIEPHDDRAYASVRLEDGSLVECSREIAVIYYLTKEWTEDLGGGLIDCEAPGGRKRYVPEYNSVIAFTIPRYHEVEAVSGRRPRYSIFGWFLEEGRSYDLYRGKGSERVGGAEMGARARGGGVARAKGSEEEGAGGKRDRGGGGGQLVRVTCPPRKLRRLPRRLAPR